MPKRQRRQDVVQETFHADDEEPVEVEVEAPGQHLKQEAVTVGYKTPKDSRERRQYKIPKSARFRSTDPRWIIVRELTSGEMDSAAAIAKKLNVPLVNELTKLGIEAVCADPSGKTGWKTINHAEAEHETLWEHTTNKVRVLMAMSVQKLNNSTDEEDAAFFATEQVL